MSFDFGNLRDAIATQGGLSARDTMALRQWSWADGRMNEHEAQALFDLNTLGKSHAPEWIDCFVEAQCEFIINSKAPKGYIDQGNAIWLIHQMDRDGHVETMGELELLVRIMEKATAVPELLTNYALRQIEHIVLHGDGPTRRGGALKPGTIEPAEVELLRRMVYAQSGDGPAIVGKAEADMLFRIKDATLGRDNAPEWPRFFVQAVGNHLMAYSSYKPLSRERAQSLEAFMDDNRPSLGSFFSRMGAGQIGEGFAALFGSKASRRDIDAEVETARAIDPQEAEWLRARIDSDHQLDDLEKALIRFIVDETGAAPY